MADVPRISVVMAVYNGERHLRETIESILGQSFGDFEFVIVNDGSTDRTREIVLSYADPRIQLVDNERNLGLAPSLNRGLRLARGEIIARQDADDISEPGRLARQVEFLDAHPEVALVGSWYREIDSSGRLLREAELSCDHVALCWRLLFVCPFVHSAVALRRSMLLGEVGLYDESLTYSMDYELWCRIARRFRVANLDEYLIRYRVHPESMTSTYGERTLEHYRLAVATVARLLGWSARQAGEHEERFEAMTALVRGTGEAHSPESLLRAVEDLLLLQQAFGGEFDLSRAERDSHRAELLRTIGWSLRTRAERCRDAGAVVGARRLLVRACRLDRSLLRRRATLRLVAEISLQPRLPGWSQRLFRRGPE